MRVTIWYHYRSIFIIVFLIVVSFYIEVRHYESNFYFFFLNVLFTSGLIALFLVVWTHVSAWKLEKFIKSYEINVKKIWGLSIDKRLGKHESV